MNNLDTEIDKSILQIILDSIDDQYETYTLEEFRKLLFEEINNN